MASVTARRLVKPNFQHAPEWAETFGPEVAELCSYADYTPDPEQEAVLDAVFAIRADGKSVCFDTTVIAARQTIKTGVEKMCAIGWLYVVPQELIIWSSHEMDTTSEAHRDLAALIENAPALAKRLKPGPARGITYAPGKQLIETKSGQRVKFKARTTSGGRGLAGNKIVLDEGFALKAAHMGALLPTLNAIPDPQLIIGSSAGKLDSDILRSFRDRGRADKGGRSSYFEWGAPREACDAGDDCTHLYGVAQGCALDRRDLWAVAITTYGIRTDEEKIESFRRTMPPEEFAREFLVWWDDPHTSGPFPAGAWEACADDGIGDDGLSVSKIAGQVHVAIDMAWDRRSCALGVAGSRDDGRTQLELVDETRTGTDWLASRAAEVVQRHDAEGVIVDPASAAGSVIPDLRSLDVEVIEVTGREFAQACGWLYDGVIRQDTVHLRQGRLDRAVGGAVRKSSGDAWRWDRLQGADISPLVAVTLAAWGITKTESSGGWAVAL